MVMHEIYVDITKSTEAYTIHGTWHGFAFRKVIFKANRWLFFGFKKVNVENGTVTHFFFLFSSFLDIFVLSLCFIVYRKNE